MDRLYETKVEVFDLNARTLFQHRSLIPSVKHGVGVVVSGFGPIFLPLDQQWRNELN